MLSVVILTKDINPVISSLLALNNRVFFGLIKISPVPEGEDYPKSSRYNNDLCSSFSSSMSGTQYYPYNTHIFPSFGVKYSELDLSDFIMLKLS